MSFTDDLWDQTSALREKIYALPFLAQLRDGTLDRDVFVHYLTQDTFYLNDYAKAMSLTSAQAAGTDDAEFWITAAHNALVAEQELHSSHVVDLHGHSPSPTTVAYSSFLVATAATGSYPVSTAALLPCFWLYADVGNRLLAETGDLSEHPYGDWIGTYADPTFNEDTTKARRVVDTCAEMVGRDTRDRMTEVYVTASRFEWMFWDAAHRREGWPV